MKLLLVFLLAASPAFAATSSTHLDTSATTATSTAGGSESVLGQSSSEIKQSEILPSSSKRKDIDEEITNTRLRAVSGAKSVWSVQSSFTYVGGSIQEPGSKERPALTPGKSIENDVRMNGRVSVKYRATDHDNLNLGVGVGWLTPGYAGQKGQSEDPYVGYSRVFRAGNMQNLFNAVVQKYTADSSTKAGYNFNTYFDYIAVTNIGTSKWQVGGISLWQHNYFTNSNVPRGVENMIGVVCPFFEYEFTRRLSFRTVSNILNYVSFQRAPSTYRHEPENQSVGVGISVTRDIYLYPNVQWVWQEIRADKTNVALQANINL